MGRGFDGDSFAACITSQAWLTTYSTESTADDSVFQDKIDELISADRNIEINDARIGIREKLFLAWKWIRKAEGSHKDLLVEAPWIR
jgi:hypothetical protein